MNAIVARIYDAKLEKRWKLPFADDRQPSNLLILPPADFKELTDYIEEVMKMGFTVKVPHQQHLEFHGMRVISSPECTEIEFATQV